MQSQNKFSSVILANWVVKIVSFVCALIVVVSIRFLNATDRVVTIPVTVLLNEESEYKPASLVPTSIEVVITGNDSIIYLVDPSLIKASVDFSDVDSTGIQRRIVSLEYDRDIFKANGLSISASPATVGILFEDENYL